MIEAGGDLARLTRPTLATVASSVGAVPVVVALLWALTQRAIEASETRVTLAGPVDAHSAVGAIIWAGLHRAVLANESGSTETS